MSSKDTLWVRVEDKYVYFETGPHMPKEPYASGMLFYAFADRSMSLKEFERWSGVRFPGKGVYGLRVKLGIVDRLRVVTEKKMVAAEHTTTKLVRVTDE